MRFVEIEGQEFVSLNTEEEYDLARIVLDLLSKRWVQGELNDLLKRIYYIRSSRGSMLRIEECLQLLEALDRYGMPDPGWEDDGTDIWREFDSEKSVQSRNEEARRMVIRIWRDVWQDHPVRSVADEFLIFPGDNIRDKPAKVIDEQEQIERDFWAEVNRVVQEFDCSRRDAYALVSDYMERGDFSETA